MNSSAILITLLVFAVQCLPIVALKPFRVILQKVEENNENAKKWNTKFNTKIGNGFSPFDYFRPLVWLMDAEVGTPVDDTQKPPLISFSFEVDSADTWILNSRYAGSGSTTFWSDSSIPFSAKDLFGPVSGYAASDNMNIVGHDFNISGQPFGLVSDSAGYSPLWAEGNLGFAWSGAGCAGYETSLLKALEPLGMFTMSFDEAYSYAVFGFANCDMCQDNWATVPLTGKGYWQFAVEGVGVDDQKFATGSKKAMLSNRVQFVYAPLEYVEWIAKQIGAQKQTDSKRDWYSVDCDRQSALPAIQINLADEQWLRVEPKDYIRRANGQCVLMFADVAYVQSAQYAQGMDWVVGMPVVRKYCQLYDIRNGEIGFAEAIQLEVQ